MKEWSKKEMKLMNERIANSVIEMELAWFEWLELFAANFNWSGMELNLEERIGE